MSSGAQNKKYTGGGARSANLGGSGGLVPREIFLSSDISDFGGHRVCQGGRQTILGCQGGAGAGGQAPLFCAFDCLIVKIHMLSCHRKIKIVYINLDTIKKINLRFNKRNDLVYINLDPIKNIKHTCQQNGDIFYSQFTNNSTH